MGYDLSNNKGEEFRWSQIFWKRVLKIAEENGWKPKGTKPPKSYGKEWDGNYWYNSKQVVEADDALNLAKSLEKSLDTLPKEEIKTPPTYYNRP